LLSDPRIRDNFEFWFFTYDTGNPIAYSAARLRNALRAAVQRFDPDGKDPAMPQMVLMGHSQGGLLVKLMVVNTGTKFWDNVSTVPLEKLQLSEESRQLLQESLFVEPLPFVSRVIFLPNLLCKKIDYGNYANYCSEGRGKRGISIKR
jgi:hypothetical protein